MKYILLLLGSFIFANCNAIGQVKSFNSITQFKNETLQYGTDCMKIFKFIPTKSMLIAPSFYSNNLGFFCKQEIKLQRTINVPFVFRLGSVQSVDYLEGKRGSSILCR